MANYSFDSLSSADFENLSRDLLQEELNISLENFKAGRDQGIDLRYSKDFKNTLIVQCKHFLNTGFSGLFSHLKNIELKKIKKLSPLKYLLVTSIGLTAKNKSAISTLLKPFIKNYGDIYDRSRINALLTKHPDVEKANFKLWLTSKAVLDRILHSSIFNQTEIETAKIKRRMKLYVQNESFFRAQEILKGLNYCIIAGIPGIGKTTLAEILLVDYLAAGYQVIKISSDIEEAYSVLEPRKKMIFYYDDFLGVTTLREKLNKNEDKKIIEFVGHIKNSKNKKFILTTREYILNRAKETYEPLSRSNFDYKKCTIDLSDYTKKIRASILFNHIYFSDLPKRYKLALLENKSFLKIIKHKNYNPRVIEWISDYQRIRLNSAINSENYVEMILGALDNPFELWEHPYSQLSPASRNLLLVLASMPDEVMFQDLEKAFLIFHSNQSKKYNFETSNLDFKNALKELDGNFIKIEKSGINLIIGFHNPSFRDFLESLILKNVLVLEDLIESMIYFDQVQIICGLRKDKKIKNSEAIEKFHEQILKAANKTIFLDQCKLGYKYNQDDFSIIKDRINSDFSSKLGYLFKNIKYNLNENEKQILDNMLLRLLGIIFEGKISGNSLIDFLNIYMSEKYKSPHDKTLLAASKNLIMSEIGKNASIELFNDFYMFYQDFNELFSEEDYENTKKFLKNHFEKELDSWLSNDNPQALRELTESIEQLSLRYDLNFNSEIGAIEGRISELSVESSDESGDPDGWRDLQNEEKISDLEIEELFDDFRN